ncbi:MAG: HAMP domain-containing histidine kinase [Oscillospiraceae bacterium]|jgi:signal transduction histidine kinase|nr:HAMP domain-containing histidine kinase [Oscillospiraceae bacterium]
MISVSRALRSSWVKAAVFLLGGGGALSAVRALSQGYNYYTGKVLGNYLHWDLAVSLAIFFFAVGLLCLSIWTSDGNRKTGLFRLWQKIDFSLLVLLSLCTLVLCVSDAQYYRNAVRLLSLSFLAYAAGVALLAATVAHLRDKTLTKTMVWLPFYRLHPFNKPIGFLMSVLLAGNLLYLFIIYFTQLGSRLGVAVFVFAMFTLAALTYFCSFLLSLSSSYEKANEEKIQAERFKAELITNVSHDIRTPLTSICNYVDLLQTLPIDNAAYVEYAGVLARKTARMKRLIDDLMEASKAGTGNLPVTLQRIDLIEITGQIAGDFEEAFAGNRLTFLCRQTEEQVFVTTDSGHLRRVMENIFANAVKYTLPDTRVLADIGRTEGAVFFSLKNISQTPLDLTAETLTRQFIRGDRTRHTEGSGLGLYIAKSLTELTGGQFSLRVTGDLFEVLIQFAKDDIAIG